MFVLIFDGPARPRFDGTQRTTALDDPVHIDHFNQIDKFFLNSFIRYDLSNLKISSISGFYDVKKNGESKDNI